LEVPKRYVIEGTENLTDEAFLKRHHRLENEERRRKRWDLQRQRELEMLEHLRHEDISPSAAAARDDDDGLNSLTFPPSPDADSVAFVEVVDTLPTCAFGFSLPAMQLGEFELPWTARGTANLGNSVGKRKRSKGNDGIAIRRSGTDKLSGNHHTCRQEPESVITTSKKKSRCAIRKRSTKRRRF